MVCWVGGHKVSQLSAVGFNVLLPRAVDHAVCSVSTLNPKPLDPNP